jgi:hypothetical protein
MGCRPVKDEERRKIIRPLEAGETLSPGWMCLLFSPEIRGVLGSQVPSATVSLTRFPEWLKDRKAAFRSSGVSLVYITRLCGGWKRPREDPQWPSH